VSEPDPPPPTPGDLRRAYYVEVRRAIGILLRATVAYYGCSYMDLLPPEAHQAVAADAAFLASIKK
jgi:hypothetical protein